MAITKAIPELWSARILEGFQRQNLYTNLVTDVSSELASGGNAVNLSSITSSVTVRDYVKDTNIADPQIMTDSSQKLTLDKQRYFNIQLDDLDAVQAKPPLMNHFSMQASRAIAEQVDKDLFSVVSNATGVASADKSTTAKFTATMTPAKQQAFVTDINEVVQKLQQANWPLSSTYLVIGTHAAFVLREYLTQKVVGTGAAGDTALSDASLSRLFGISVYVSPNMPSNLTSASTLAGLFGVRDAVYFARQIQKIEPYRLEKRFADGLKGLFVYGSRRVFNNHVHLLSTGS